MMDIAKDPRVEADNRVALIDWDRTLRPGWTLEPWLEYLVERRYVNQSTLADLEYLISSFAAGDLDHDQLAQEANGLYALAIAGQTVDSIAKLSHAFATEDI